MKKNLLSCDMSSKVIFFLLFIAAITSFDFSDFLKSKTNYKYEKDMILNKKSSIVFQTILPYYQNIALEDAIEMRKEVVEKISNVYPSGTDDHLKKDLVSILNTKDFTPFLKAVSDVTSKNIFLGITGDNRDSNDANAFNYDGIFSDNSLNCASFGSIRNWSNESKMHFNKKLPMEVRDDIFIKGKSESFWIFLNVPKSMPFYKDLKNLKHPSIEELKIIFKKNNGDMRIFNYIEFINVAHVFRYTDILGNKVLSQNGIRQKNYVFAINQPFVLNDALIKDNNIKRNEKLLLLDKELKKLSLKYSQKKFPIMCKTLIELSVSLLIFLFVPLRIGTKKR